VTPLLTLLAGLCSAAPRPSATPVRITYYAAVAERDFGDAATEPVRWSLPGSTETHSSLFVKGFASRDAEDPKRPGLSGAAMEGAGLIDIALHQGDAALRGAWERGYRVLTLERWDTRTRTPTFILTRSPKTATGDAVAGRSAAARPGNRLFPLGSEVEVLCPGRPAERRVVDDTCSSCGSDAHLDLYVAPERVRDGVFRCRARLLGRAAP
jgi:hypothetical protein